VDSAAEHNGRTLWLPGYRHMLEADYETIPDLRFVIVFLVSDWSTVAARQVMRLKYIGDS